MEKADYSFEGWVGVDEESGNGQMVWREFEPKPWEETDIDIKITHCGVCGSDLHTLRSGWRKTNYPVCVGHELVGIAVRVGFKAVGGIQVGDRVGVGAQSDACLGRMGDCPECAMGCEQYCPHFVGTYAAVHYNGAKSYGGYGLYNRAPSHFVVKIPDSIPSAEAAPLLCAGVTMFSPLKRNECGPGKNVGIIGVGGLGHIGILLARAMGASRVVSISRAASKGVDAYQMGVNQHIATADEPDWATKYARSLDLIVSTVSSSTIPMAEYFKLLRTGGTLVQVGLPDDGTLQAPVRPLLRRLRLESSLVGSPDEIREVLDLVAAKNIRPWISVVPMEEANKCIVDMEAGRAKYRYVLAND